MVNRNLSVLVRTCVWTLLFTALAMPANAQQETAPLPEPSSFLAKVRERLFLDEEAQRGYTYQEKRQEIRVTRLGKVELGRVRLFEVYASPEPGHRYRRLIADDGVPIEPGELRRRDAAYQQYVRNLHESRVHETPAQRAQRLAKDAGERRERDALVADVFHTFDMKLVRRDAVEGVTAIVAELTPRPNAAATSKIGKHLKKFRGEVWISEADQQVIKIDMESTDPVLIGWGIVGRLREGSRLTVERRKVNGEVWLPYRTRIQLRGRSLLFRKFDLVAVTEFSNYRKFVVDTKETFGGQP
jgi:hypothetical protein